jgi:hypothetical protein
VHPGPFVELVRDEMPLFGRGKAHFNKTREGKQRYNVEWHESINSNSRCYQTRATVSEDAELEGTCCVDGGATTVVVGAEVNTNEHLPRNHPFKRK